VTASGIVGDAPNEVAGETLDEKERVEENDRVVVGDVSSDPPRPPVDVGVCVSDRDCLSVCLYPDVCVAPRRFVEPPPPPPPPPAPRGSWGGGGGGRRDTTGVGG